MPIRHAIPCNYACRRDFVRRIGDFILFGLTIGNSSNRKEPTLIIEAKSVEGHPLSMYVYLENQSGYTPFKFYETGLHNATVTNYQAFVFDHWDDGSSSRSRIIELNDNTAKTITAIYR